MQQRFHGTVENNTVDGTVNMGLFVSIYTIDVIKDNTGKLMVCKNGLSEMLSSPYMAVRAFMAIVERSSFQENRTILYETVILGKLTAVSSEP